jgi:DNA-binding NtrC family response regulator
VRAESTDAMPVGISMDQPMKEAREEFEKLYLEHHFSLAEGNVSRMAQAVGIDRANLYKKLRDRGIEIKSR